MPFAGVEEDVDVIEAMLVLLGRRIVFIVPGTPVRLCMEIA